MALRGLIAECGNCHYGDIKVAKEMIHVAKESGANFVKFQCIDPRKVTHGSMDFAFYQKVAFTFEEYQMLKMHGDDLKIPVFFSIFGEKFKPLLKMFPSMPYKISGQQFKTMEKEDLWEYNNANTIISVPRCDGHVLVEKMHYISDMNIMYVSPYLPMSVKLDIIGDYMNLFKRPIGYSDHTMGINVCKTAIADYGCQLIEKHFFLGNMITWADQEYRDCFHSATPEQFEELAIFYDKEFS